MKSLVYVSPVNKQQYLDLPVTFISSIDKLCCFPKGFEVYVIQ